MKLSRTFQILSTHSFIERESGGTVVFLFDLLFLQHGFRFCFILEKLAVSPFADSWPCDAPQPSSVANLNLFECDGGLAHGNEIFRKDRLLVNYSSTGVQSWCETTDF